MGSNDVFIGAFVSELTPCRLYETVVVKTMEIKKECFPEIKTKHLTLLFIRCQTHIKVLF